MAFHPRRQFSEIDRVLCHDDAILGDAAREDEVIRLAEAAPVSGMDGVVIARRIEALGEPWREAFVDEEPQTPLAHGRPPGLPTIGCVRA